MQDGTTIIDMNVEQRIISRKRRAPVSRIDNKEKRTHGWFARVYRAEWVGSRSFADKKYAGRSASKAAAYKWVAIAEERLPIIPPMPVIRKAAMYLRHDKRRKNSSFFDVYLPALTGDASATHKLYFKTDSKEERERQHRIANSMVTNQNFLLVEAHKKAMLKWQREYERIMQQILAMWDEIKAMPV
jgi:hypothetical protein